MFTKEMMKALEADGEKLRQLTGEDHGPEFFGEESPLLEQVALVLEAHGVDEGLRETVLDMLAHWEAEKGKEVDHD